MNDHNLDDLIIDTIAPKNNKTKSLLTLVALLIIVLIVGIILSKTLLKSPQNDELSFEEDMSGMIAPELKLQENTEAAKPKEASALSSVIEEKYTEEKSETKVPEATEEETVTIEENVSHMNQEKNTQTVEIENSTLDEVKTATKLPETQKPVQKESPKVLTGSKPKIKIKKTESASRKQAVKQHTSTTSSMGSYYVQVGSFRDKPSTRFLSIITNSGFKYHVTNPDRTGYKKLLIGPYKTRAEVDKARNIIRDRIHKSAFVVQK